MKIGEYGYVSKVLAPGVTDEIMDHLIESRAENSPDNYLEMVIELLGTIGDSICVGSGKEEPDNEVLHYILHSLKCRWTPDGDVEEEPSKSNVIKFPEIH